MRIPFFLKVISGGIFGASFLLFVGVPLWTVVWKAWTELEGSTPYFDPVILSITLATFQQAVWSVLFSIALGVPLGVVLGRRLKSGSRLAGLSHVLCSVPFVVPSIVAAMSWVTLLSLFQSSVLYSVEAVILAHIFFNAPWVAYLVAQSMQDVRDSEIQAARLLGGGHLAQWRWVYWPTVKWTLGAAVAQVFSFCVMSFVLVLILGGGPPVETLETAIYTRVRFGELDLPGAIVCAIYQLFMTLIPWGGILYLRKRSKVSTVSRGQSHSKGRIIKRDFALVMVSFLVLVPYIVLVVSAFLQGLGVQSSSEWTALTLAFEVSLQLAFLSAAFSVVFAGAALIWSLSLKKHPLWRAMVEVAMTLPSGISILIIGLGFWMAYSHWVDPFEGSLMAMVCLQSVIFGSIAFRMMWGFLHSSSKDQLESALLLGASPMRAFFVVEWPKWKWILLRVYLLVWAASLGEVAAVSLFYSEELIPLPLLVTRWMAQYRFESAQTLSVGLLVLSVTAVLLASFLYPETGRKSDERASC